MGSGTSTSTHQRLDVVCIIVGLFIFPTRAGSGRYSQSMREALFGRQGMFSGIMWEFVVSILDTDKASEKQNNHQTFPSSLHYLYIVKLSCKLCYLGTCFRHGYIIKYALVFDSTIL